MPARRSSARRRGGQKIRSGAVLFKYFRHIARADLKALFPNVRVVMSLSDHLTLGGAGAARRRADPDQARLDLDGAVCRGRLLSRSHRHDPRQRHRAGAGRAKRPVRARRLRVAAMGKFPPPVADPSEAAHRQHLLPQRQQQFRHFQLPHWRGGGAGLEGSAAGLLRPADGRRRRSRARRSARASRSCWRACSAFRPISRSTTRWRG